MPKKVLTVTDLARMGGRAYIAQTTPEEHRDRSSRGGRSAWASMSPEDRSAEMKRRRAKAAASRSGRRT